MKFNDVIDPVVRSINYIRAKVLNRRQFRVLFEDEINEFGELHLYCAVRWLSKSEILKHFFLSQDRGIAIFRRKAGNDQ